MLEHGETETQQSVLVRQVCVQNELGLHARPAGKIAQEAQKFAADIFLSVGEQQVDAKSILDILTLAAGRGCELRIIARGDDAATAIEHLSKLFKTRLGDDR